MAETSKHDVKSPQEIEDEIKSTPTETWNPFTVLPKEMYVKIFDKLESPTDKQNFMNAHVKWYELFESSRTVFLFEKVLGEVVKKDDQHYFVKNNWERTFKNYQNCRLVCRDWNDGAENFFQLYGNLFRVEDEGITFGSDFAYEPRNSFVWYTATKAEKDLEMFSMTHPPSKNPFFSRRVTLLSIFDVSLLKGLALGLREIEADDEEVDGDAELEEIEREFEGAETTERYRTSVEAILDRYGEHVWHCKIEIKDLLNPEACLLIAKWLELMPELKTLTLINQSDQSFSGMEIEDMDLVPPQLKNLFFLKTSRLSPIAFNKLFGNVVVEKIQIDIRFWKGVFFRNLEFDRRNLNEAFFTLKGLNDYKHLEESEPFLTLKKLVIALEFETYKEKNDRTYPFFEWKMIFKILETKFPVLEELTLRLPKAVSEEDKWTVIKQSFKCQLNLPRLKKLWISLPNLCSLDFLYPCRFLEELRVILESPGWDNQKFIGLRGIWWGEKLVFNVDLENMFEESIPRAFSKLREVKIRDKFGFRKVSLSANWQRENIDDQAILKTYN